MEAKIENGFAAVESGEWIVARGQPAGVRGSFAAVSAPKVEGRGFWKRLFEPDRRRLEFLRLEGEMWCASSERPFLTRLDLGERVSVVTDKLLLAPSSSRRAGTLVKTIPFSFRSAFSTTELEIGWALAATRSRVAKVVVKEGETLGVRPEAVVAWTGRAPTGFCPKLRLRDMILPRAPRTLVLDFHGPAIVWFEGCEGPKGFRKGPAAR